MKFLSRIFLAIIFFVPFFASAQQEMDSIFPGVDSLYREDQVYLGFTYNILSGMPEDISQSGLSGGFHAGLMRDFPINNQRNIALAVGLGWSINTFGQNLFIGEEKENGASFFQALEEGNYDSNRFSTQSIDVPLQFRWRTSSAERYKFWRVYTGIKLGYVYYFKSTFVQSGNKFNQTKVPEFNRFRTGVTFTFGYNTFNFHFYYSLNPFFNDVAQINGQGIDMTNFQVGLMFYIL